MVSLRTEYPVTVLGSAIKEENLLLTPNCCVARVLIGLINEDLEPDIGANAE